VTILQPAGWPRPRGYSAGIAVRGTVIYVSGQVGWDETGRFGTCDLAPQVRQALRNVVAVLAEGGAGPEHIVRMTWYVTSRTEYLENTAAIGAAYREVIGRHFPAMSVVEVSGLLEEMAKVEIEVTAVLPTELLPS
jgi:enamine deaminase RidA (YjgF/YER057c/UK114 family)